MRKLNSMILVIISLFISLDAAAMTYGQKLCNQPGFNCVQVQYGDSWESLFPDIYTRDMVMRVNRMNVMLNPGMVIAVPESTHVQAKDLAPFSLHINKTGNKTLIIDPKTLAWGAYSKEGNLVSWGPASLGKDYCPDVRRGCRTVTGKFSVIREGGANCVSSKYPLETNGGAPMPYCMHFHEGYALHGSDFVPGKMASHGCVRLFVEDARWLNQEFIEPGTTVIVKSYG